MASNYTEDELYLIASLPHTIGAAMAFVGHSGLFGTGKEMFVSATSILNGVKAELPAIRVAPGLTEGAKMVVELAK